MRSNKYNLLIIGTIIALAVSRLIPHPPNFTPLGGIAILGAAYLRSPYMKYLIPVLAFYISDLLVSNLIYASFYPEQSFVWFSGHMIWNYAAIVAVVALSSRIMKKKNWKNLAAASFTGAVLFFVISNFGSWAGNPMYPQDIGGLISCYIAGLPFFPNTLISTAVFAGIGFGIMEYGHYRLFQKESATR